MEKTVAKTTKPKHPRLYERARMRARGLYRQNVKVFSRND